MCVVSGSESIAVVARLSPGWAAVKETEGKAEPFRDIGGALGDKPECSVASRCRL